jgi:hypothetical protein
VKIVCVVEEKGLGFSHMMLAWHNLLHFQPFWEEAVVVVKCMEEVVVKCEGGVVVKCMEEVVVLPLLKKVVGCVCRKEYSKKKIES